jgi:short-subunit dehydrogenase
MRMLQNKRILLTGAASGIGRALALLLAQRGASLLLVDRDEAGLSATGAECRTLGAETTTRHFDLAVADEVKALGAEVQDALGPLDMLVNNAGVVHYGPTAQMSCQDMERLLAVNLLAPLRLTQALLPHLRTRPQAHIVNVSSLYGFLATPNCAAYHASKFGLLGFSESLHLELRGSNVAVTTVCPGFVATRLFESGTGGEEGGVRQPPAWLTTTPEHVARRIVRGIERRQRMVIVTPLAWILYYVNRYAPWMLPLLGRRLH